MDKSEVIMVLQSGQPIEIVFEKVDGSKRNMTATLSNDMIPAGDEDHQKNKKKKNPEVQAVWDISAQGWRSFRWDKLLTVQGREYNEKD